MDKLTGIFNRYGNLGAGDVPSSIDADFKTVLGELGAKKIEKNISAALRSRSTPPIADILSEWYTTLPKDQRSAFLRRLDKLIREAGGVEAMGFSLTPELFKIEDLRDSFPKFEASVPDLAERVAAQYINVPKLILNITPSVRAEVLRTVALDEQPAAKPAQAAQPPLIEEVELVPAGMLEIGEPAPPPRYGSVELFEETGAGVKGDPFEPQQTFQEGKPFIAEISIRLKPRGVTPKGDRKPIREPLQAEPVDIWITAEAKDFNVDPRVNKITLPPKGDSSVALCRLTPRRASSGAKDLLQIRFRFFYKLNLLQTIILRGGARLGVSFDETGDAAAEVAPPELLMPEVQSDANDFDLFEPNQLQITIDPDGQQFQITFTYGDADKDVLSLPASVSLNTEQLSSEIAGARKSLFLVSSSDTLGRQLQGLDGEFSDHLKVLADRGRKLWSLLFDRGEGQEITTVGQILKENPLPEGSRIQVSINKGAASFAFAWNLLYDANSTVEEVYSHDGFWGMRYVIEQRQISPTNPVLPTEAAPGIEIAAMYWKFAQVPAQQKYLDALLKQFGARFASGKPIDDAKTALNCIKARSSHILYFCTHGYTELPDGERFGVTVSDFLHIYNNLPDGSETKRAWRNIAEDLSNKQFESDDSWIELTAGRLLLQDLYGAIAQLPLRPFVILNMCDSAQITPALSQSFIDLFLSRGARAVVGTECSVRPVFADFVGRELLLSLFSGVPVGEALRQIRIAAAKEKNLLGLSYTQFGFAGAAIQPAPVKPQN